MPGRIWTVPEIGWVTEVVAGVAGWPVVVWASARCVPARNPIAATRDRVIRIRFSMPPSLRGSSGAATATMGLG